MRALSSISGLVDEHDDGPGTYELRMEAIGGRVDGHAWSIVLDEYEARVYLGLISHIMRRRANGAGLRA